MARTEQILVVKRDVLFSKTSAWLGVKKGLMSDFQELITQHQEFHPRDQMETDFTYKQIIPYLIFCHDDRYFVMQRSDNASEQRLKGKYSLGIGGHIRKEDLQGITIADWARREFCEEIEYNGNFSVEPIGVLNDDTDDVGKVHIGLVLLLKGDSDDIKIRSELKSGSLMTKKECKDLLLSMESWSAHIVHDLWSKE